MKDGEFADVELKLPVNQAVRWISIFGILFFLWMAFLSKLNNEGIGYIIAFIGCSLLQVFGVLLSFSTIQVSRKSIRATILYTKYTIDWDEVQTIETDIASILELDGLNETDWDFGSTVAFLGNEKCFPVQLAMLGKGKAAFLKFLEEIINERQIEVKPLSAAWMRHKNTKVKAYES
ncbi:MAG: hypothetical protein IPP66_05415 [Anaerolineales bacterium]|nr:hypothetical protein [Anaerolineales bacterium]